MTSSLDYEVRPLSWDKIGEVAESIRVQLGLSSHPSFPIVTVVEEILSLRFELFDFEIGTHNEMDGAEGLTCPNGNFIMIREDVYEKACEGDARARFTLAHELGHWALHSNSNMPLARKVSSAVVPAYRRAEPQANQFAAELLMPRRLVQSYMDANSIMTVFGVSKKAANARRDFLVKKGLI